jgi:transcriptional regulator with XRE-family HTH domain
MNVSTLIKQQLGELSLDQRDLATAAQVTESYISQLLTGKKVPPAAHRTDIYSKMEAFLKLPEGELSKLADYQRLEELKGKLGNPPSPLFDELRELILSKCANKKEEQIRMIFEKQPFGMLEQLVTTKLVDMVKTVVEKEWLNEDWLREVAQFSGRSYNQMRGMVKEFLEKDIFNVSIENCNAFLEPLIESWDVDLENFGMKIMLNHKMIRNNIKILGFVEKEAAQSSEEETGLVEFLNDAELSSGIIQEEVTFLRQLRFQTKRPTKLYYYRELQNLRDPLHFRIV